MGMCRDSGSCEIDVVKEMAEGLGSTGLRLEDILEKANVARAKALHLLEATVEGSPCRSDLNEAIRAYNDLVDKAEDALRWLLIQREACGFRTHRNVQVYYPIPKKIPMLKS
jgi:hypothetical protein